MPKEPRTQLQEEILENYPRLRRADTFKFRCHPGISCFNHCCADVNIFLSPYDVLRMKNRLGLESGEFLDRFAVMPVQRDMKTPVVVLRMNDDEEKTCPFVTNTGCALYEDRPWPCRMYPLGLASPSEASREEEFFFLLEEDVCQGHECDVEWTVARWIEEQGIELYNEFGEFHKRITLHPEIQEGKPLEPKQTEMLFTACYDLDKFRRFLFETSFFERFEIAPGTIEQLKTDDVELLRLGFRWIRFFVLKENTLRVWEEVLKARQEQLS